MKVDIFVNIKHITTNCKQHLNLIVCSFLYLLYLVNSCSTHKLQTVYTLRELKSPVWLKHDIYHNGVDGWKATIKITKDKYPKP